MILNWKQVAQVRLEKTTNIESCTNKANKENWINETSQTLTTIGLNFIGGDDDDVTILGVCVLDLVIKKDAFVDGLVCAPLGGWGGDSFVDVPDDDEDRELVSSLLLVDLALGMDISGWEEDRSV